MVQCHINIHLCAHMAPNTYSFMTKSLFIFIDTSKQNQKLLPSLKQTKIKVFFSVENSKVTLRDSNIITK